MQQEDEDSLLRSVALQNASSILQARRRAEHDLLHAKEALELRTQQLAQSLSMMRATLESTSNGILVTDDAGAVTDFNENYLQIWQMPRELIEARDHRPIVEFVARHFPDPGAFMDRVYEIYKAAPPESHDVLELSNGKVFERFSKVQMLDGRNVGRVWSFSDITERRRLLESERAARAEAERASAMKDEFLATLSHELRTPLSAMLGWSQVLRRQYQGEAQLQKGLETIERNARVQTQLIEDLLDMSRITSGNLRLDIQPVEPVAVIAAAVDTVRPAAEAKGIRIEKLLDPSAGPVSGDASRLQQVLWNLLSNAIKFTPKDGKVQVLLERVNSHIEISVADTGIGIDPDFLPFVFDRFRQANASSTRTFGGLGLGLSIVRNLIELHGGTVSASSRGENLGSTFSVHLPLTVVHRRSMSAQRLHPAAPGPAVEFEYADLSGVTVLVVDDEPDARDLVRRLLEDCDARVITAAAADEALQLVVQHRPDVLVSDIGMPDVDGYELLRRVRRLDAGAGGKVPAIALTAFARSEDRTRALRAGFLVHVSKPVEPSELIATVASVAGRAGTGPTE